MEVRFGKAEGIRMELKNLLERGCFLKGCTEFSMCVLKDIAED